MDDSVLGDDAIFGRAGLDELELCLTHATANLEGITFPYRPVSLEEVRLERNLEKISTKAFNRVVEWQYMDPLAVRVASSTKTRLGLRKVSQRV